VVVPFVVLTAALALMMTKAFPEGPTLIPVTPLHGLTVSDVCLLTVAGVAAAFVWRARRL
jgi:hypothetical protein